MLSVVPIKSSSISSGYYLKQDGNYYIEDKKQSDLYEWFGKGAKALGLVGTVDLKDHEKVYSGQLPNGEMIGKKMPDGSIQGRPGYDLTFSMNKDISLIICCSKDKALSDYFLNAHMNAVKTVLTEVEKRAQARLTENNATTYQTTKNMVASLCTHFSSRAGDPEVHTHALIANATERLDGKWRALATDMSRKHGFFEMIRDHAVYFGMLYQNDMAYATKQIGFEVERVHKNGMFQIKDFPSDMRDFFSKRRKQIEDIIKTLNPSVQNNKKIHDQVAQHSKAGKINMGVGSFFAKAKNDMQIYLDRSIEKREFDEIINSCREKTIDQKVFDASDKEAAIEAITDAISHESQFSVLLDANKILNKAITFDLGQSKHQDLLLALNHVEKLKLLLPLENGKYTSKALLEREKEILNIANQSASRLTVIREPSSLKDKQALLSDLISEYEKNNKKVKILSINKSMGNQHNDYARKNDMSIWQRLKTMGKGDLAHGINSFLHTYESDLKMPFNNFFTKKGKEVFIVDDAQRLSLGTMQKLLTLTQKREANIIFLKHTEGMRNVLSGNPLEIIERCDILKMDARNLHASKTPAITNDHLKISITQAEKKTSDKKHSQELRQMELAKTIAKEYSNSLSQTLVLSQSKASAQKLNIAIRDELISNGKVGFEQTYITVTEPVFLSKEEQKHAKFYPQDTFIKTYIGKGQFNITKIVRHDLETNKIIIENVKGKRSSITPKSIIELIKKNETKLYTEKRIGIALGDRCRITHSNKQTKALYLKMGESYVISDINEKKLTLESSNKSDKPISIKIDKLNGIPLSYDYARSIHEPLNKNKKNQILCDLPHHAINSNIITELARHTESLHLFTDNKDKAEKKLHVDQFRQNALDQKITDISKEKTPQRSVLDYAISVVESREAAFSQESMIKKALSYKMASVNLTEIQAEIKNLLNDGVLHAREDLFGEVVFATHEAMRLEREIIDQVKNGKNQVKGFVSEETATQFLNNSTLTQGQKDACKLIATTNDRFIMIQGYAGTGKSTMLHTLIGDSTLDTLRGLLPKEFEVRAIAPTHQAVIELQKKGIEAQTLKSFLVDNKIDQSNINAGLKNKLIIVDESSMISNSDFHQLQKIIEKQDARCAYLGDIAQLSAVEAGKPSELSYISKEADIATAIMHENKRQINPELKKIADLLMEGGSKNFSNALTFLEKNGSIIEINPEKNNVGQQASSISALAKEYASLNQDERSQTLVAAATNRDRIEVNDEIRGFLKKQGELSESGVHMRILDDSRLTNAELRVAEHYKSGMVVKYQNEYKEVIKSDSESNIVTLCDHKGDASVLSLSNMPKNDFLELYGTRTIEINPGEHIKFTKTDRERDRRANSLLTVESVDLKNQQIIAKTTHGEKQIIYFSDTENQHIDYSYCSTTHGLQAATSKSVFILSNSYNKLSNTMRQLYVALTRAQEKAIIFTDDKEKIKRQIIWNAGEKTSALEAMGLLEKRNQVINRKKYSPEKTTSDTKAQNTLDAKLIEKNLKIQAKGIIQNILGEPNHALSNAVNWRYGSKGSLSVIVDGDKAGLFHNFETGEKGGMINLIMSELRLPFKEALKHASVLLGGSHQFNVKHNNSSLKNPQKTIDVDETCKKQVYINTLIAKSKPIEGTLAEKYLKSRAITDIKNTTLRFIEHVTTGNGNKDKVAFSSALIAIAHDDNNKAKAIQLTYLDKKTGAKIPELPIIKRTLNSPTGAFVNLTSHVKTPEITFIVEGVETALSIRDGAASIKNAQVIATLGKSNLQNIPTEKIAATVVLVLDNDLKNPLDASIKKAIQTFEEQGKRVVTIFPDSINNKKTDYNDLAQAGKTHQITHDINRAIEINKNAPQKSPEVREFQVKQPARYQDMEREFLG